MNKKKEDVMRRIKSISICFWNSTDSFSYKPDECGIILKAGKGDKDLLPALLESDIDMFLASYFTIEIPYKDFDRKIDKSSNDKEETILHRLLKKEDIHGAIIHFEDNSTLDIYVPCELDDNRNNRYQSNIVQKGASSIKAVIAYEPNIKRNFIDSIDLVFDDGDFISSLAIGKEILSVKARAGYKQIETNLFAEKKDIVNHIKITFASAVTQSLFTRNSQARKQENLNIILGSKRIETVILRYRKGNEEAWFIPEELKQTVMTADNADNIHILTVSYT